VPKTLQFAKLAYRHSKYAINKRCRHIVDRDSFELLKPFLYIFYFLGTSAVCKNFTTALYIHIRTYNYLQNCCHVTHLTTSDKT